MLNFFSDFASIAKFIICELTGVVKCDQFQWNWQNWTKWKWFDEAIHQPKQAFSHNGKNLFFFPTKCSTDILCQLNVNLVFFSNLNVVFPYLQLIDWRIKIRRARLMTWKLVNNNKPYDLLEILEKWCKTNNNNNTNNSTKSRFTAIQEIRFQVNEDRTHSNIFLSYLCELYGLYFLCTAEQKKKWIAKPAIEWSETAKCVRVCVK